MPRRLRHLAPLAAGALAVAWGTRRASARPVTRADPPSEPVPPPAPPPAAAPAPPPPPPSKRFTVAEVVLGVVGILAATSPLIGLAVLGIDMAIGDDGIHPPTVLGSAVGTLVGFVAGLLLLSLVEWMRDRRRARERAAWLRWRRAVGMHETSGASSGSSSDGYTPTWVDYGAGSYGGYDGGAGYDGGGSYDGGGGGGYSSSY